MGIGQIMYFSKGSSCRAWAPEAGERIGLGNECRLVPGSPSSYFM